MPSQLKDLDDQISFGNIDTVQWESAQDFFDANSESTIDSTNNPTDQRDKHSSRTSHSTISASGSGGNGKGKGKDKQL